MKLNSALTLAFCVIGLNACTSLPERSSTPAANQAPQPSALIPTISAKTLAATTAIIQIPPVLIPLVAPEAELRAAEARLNPRSQNTRQNRRAARTTTAPVAAAPTPPQTVEMFDAGKIDDQFLYLIEKAGNYPPTFADRRERQEAEAEIKAIISILDPLAVAPNASFDVLIRAVQANQIARNLDLGVQSSVKAGVYMRRAIALQPDNPLANYWYGVMLAEGGGLKEGIPYLNKAAKDGYKKAYLALAQAYLHLSQNRNAISTLESYATAEPEQQARMTQLIEQIRSGNPPATLPR